MEALTTSTSATTNTDSFTPRVNLDARKAGPDMFRRIIPAIRYIFKDFKGNLSVTARDKRVYILT